MIIKVNISFFTFICFVHLVSYGQSIMSISSIPDSLKENANAVYLLDEGSFEIYKDNKATFKVKQIVAILNSKAQKHATMVVGYDKHTKVNYLNSSLYDSNGKLLKVLKKKEVKDYSSYDGFSVYSDNRLKYADLRQNNYPYIVEFEYEVEYKYTFSIPDWRVLPGENVSVVKSKYSIRSPKEYKPRVKIENTDVSFTEQDQGESVHMEIEFNNLISRERELYGPRFDEIRPIVYCAPSKFSYDEYKGDMSTWNGFANWLNQLNGGRDALSEETVSELKEITSELNSREEKIKAVYEYLQNRTRYVSIQLGIGGYQPFPASEVDELGYGDCKALSNYTYSMLKAIGIESNYTLVYAGSNPPKLDPEFPNNRFNHAILCVPNEKDTIWLECTSQTRSFGYMGNFTGDRDVLIVNENGGNIVHTTTYNKEDNTQFGVANVSLNENGQATASIEIKYSGLQTGNNGLSSLIRETKKDKEQWVYKNTGISDFTIQDFSFEIEKKKIPTVTEQLDIVINNFTSAKGNRLFFAPNLMNQWSSNPKKYKDRQTDVIRKFTGIDIDTIVYTIPEKFYAEYLPEPINIETDFGKYTSSVKFNEGKLIYIRKLELNKGRFPKESYDDFREFYKDISKADNTKVVFVDRT